MTDLKAPYPFWEGTTSKNTLYKADEKGIIAGISHPDEAEIIRAGCSVYFPASESESESESEDGAESEDGTDRVEAVAPTALESEAAPVPVPVPVYGNPEEGALSSLSSTRRSNTA